MVMVRNTRYTKLECVGRGGSSKVFKVHTLPNSLFCHITMSIFCRQKSAQPEESAIQGRQAGAVEIGQVHSSPTSSPPPASHTLPTPPTGLELLNGRDRSPP